ncbi:MAG: NAD+ synthase [Planctomycetes bacterium]|nr:NAD+ synthase [Planctomycetota bacterium]
MKIALCQTNPTVGDIPGNAAKIRNFCGRAREAGADAAVFPELTLVGYPPRDLLLKDAFLDDQFAALDDLAGTLKGITAVVGLVTRHSGQRRLLHNSAAVIRDGRTVATAHKRLLPTYDVFDEERYFTPGRETLIAEIAGARVAVTICEDAWNDADFWTGRASWAGRKTYTRDPVAEAASAGAEIILNLSASPFQLGKETLRRDMLAFSAKKYGLPMAFVNQVGGNDELVFDGGSLGISGSGDVVAACRRFEEDIVVFDTAGSKREPGPAECLPEEEVYRALVLGTRDYVRKCGFTRGIVGLSGGIDSGLVAVIAAEALGPENVTAVLMPSMYSSPGSITDAEALTGNLAVKSVTIPITGVYQSFLDTLRTVSSGTPAGVAEENIQARIRGTILMALSNKFGGLVLSTGNKSEVSVGYCTLYGDMAGGLDVLGDVPKTFVYRIARWINREREIIPKSSITKPPSAELRPDQTDQDSLPPYDVLDRILKAYVEEEKGASEIIASGNDRDLVAQVIRLVDRSEYKRKQAAGVLKVTGRAFGFGRRMPIAQGYKQEI